MGIIVAIGGYKKDWAPGVAFDTPLKIDRQIVGLTGKAHPKALFIPTASSDSDGYTEAWIQNYQDKLGCRVDVLRLIKEKPSFTEIEAKILGADLIYVGGGNTLMMMNLWRRLGVDKLLRTAWERGIVLCGVSAGSICWFEWGVSDSRQFKNPKSHEYIRVRGLGFLKGLHCPHFDPVPSRTNWRLKGYEKIMRKFGGECLCLANGEARVFEGA